LNAFKDLWKCGIIHRDLKPGNIFFHNGQVKLGDFGFCQKLKPGYKTKQGYGSPIYMAPELHKRKFYDHKADVYSLGTTIYELIFGTCPYEANDFQELQMKID